MWICYTEAMSLFGMQKHHNFGQKLAAILHLPHKASPAEKVINTAFHLILYISLILIGYLLAQLQNVAG